MLSKHGRLESSILSALWNLESNGIFTNSVKDVHEIISQNSGIDRAYTTIKTVMDRLVQKKILLRFKQSNKFYYRTAYSCDEIIEKSLIDIADRFLDKDLDKLHNVLISIKEKNCLSI